MVPTINLLILRQKSDTTNTLYLQSPLMNSVYGKGTRIVIDYTTGQVSLELSSVSCIWEGKYRAVHIFHRKCIEGNIDFAV